MSGAVKTEAPVQETMTNPAWVQHLLDGNAEWVSGDWNDHHARLPAIPRLGMAVVACMDTRHVVETVLGLKIGNAKIIRNAGNKVDETTLRSLRVAVHAMDVAHIVVMGHTDCGMTRVANAEGLGERLARATGGDPADALAALGGFPDVEENVRNGIRALHEDPTIPDDVEVVGLVYDNDTGRVRVAVPCHKVGETLPATR